MAKKPTLEPKIGHRNRIVAKRSRLSKRWCDGCDAWLVPDGAKCPVCGHKHPTKRLKKNGPYD